MWAGAILHEVISSYFVQRLTLLVPKGRGNVLPVQLLESAKGAYAGHA
jgi:hypothetical protein